MALFVWAFWHTFEDLWLVWRTNDDYSAGQLVPLAAGFMVFARRRRLTGISPTFDTLGVAVFVLGLLLNLFGVYYLFASFCNLGLLICANGLALTLLGREGYKRIWIPCLFLTLMVPLPVRIHDSVMLPLQGFCAQASGVILEMIGVPAVRDGHILTINDYRVAVAEACNGLRMALSFLTVAGVVAVLIRRPTWQKLAVLFSSVPIAIACNIFRIVLTCVLCHFGYRHLTQGMLHDFAGLLMMPLALGLIGLELFAFSKFHSHLFKNSSRSVIMNRFGGPTSHAGVVWR